MLSNDGDGNRQPDDIGATGTFRGITVSYIILIQLTANDEVFLLSGCELNNLHEIRHQVAGFCLDWLNAGASVGCCCDQDLFNRVVVHIHNGFNLW
eukprot:2794755-Ditylum_brightwellii.AAC.1